METKLMQRCAKNCIEDITSEKLTPEEGACLTTCVDKSWVFYDGFFQKQGGLQRQMLQGA